MLGLVVPHFLRLLNIPLSLYLLALFSQFVGSFFCPAVCPLKLRSLPAGFSSSGRTWNLILSLSWRTDSPLSTARMHGRSVLHIIVTSSHYLGCAALPGGNVLCISYFLPFMPPFIPFPACSPFVAMSLFWCRSTPPLLSPATSYTHCNHSTHTCRVLWTGIG